jgi:hypothetical protein
MTWTVWFTTLMDDVRVEVGKSRPFSGCTDVGNEDIDNFQPVYPIRGDTYHCQPLGAATGSRPVGVKLDDVPRLGIAGYFKTGPNFQDQYPSGGKTFVRQFVEVPIMPQCQSPKVSLKQ